MTILDLIYPPCICEPESLCSCIYPIPTILGVLVLGIFIYIMKIMIDKRDEEVSQKSHNR